MAQNHDNNNNHHIAPPATSSDSTMSPCNGSTGGGGLVLLGAIDKGKGVAKTEAHDEDGRSKGKISMANAIAAAASRDGGGSGCRRGDRELHIATERERRKRMSEMFSKLHGLLPTLPDKVDKSSIVMEAIHYIKSLEGTLNELEKRKLEMQLARGKGGGAGVSSSVTPPPPAVLPDGGIWPAGATPAPPVVTTTPTPTPVGLQTWSGPNVVLSLSGSDACINVCATRRPGVLTMVMAVLEKHNIDVVTSGISSDSARSMFTIHARINGASSQFGANVPSEEIYKLAVSEIMVWLSE